MKNVKRKIASLLLALAVIFSMVPAAMAAGGTVSLAVGGQTELTADFPDTLFSGSIPIAALIGVQWDYAGTGATVYGDGDSATVYGYAYGSGYVTATPLYAYWIGGLGNQTSTGQAMSWTVSVGGAPITNIPGTTVPGTTPGTTPGVPSSYLSSLSYTTNAPKAGESAYVSVVTNSNLYTVDSVIWSSLNPTVASVYGEGAQAIVTVQPTATLYAKATITATVTINYNGNYYKTEELGYTLTVGGTNTAGTTVPGTNIPGTILPGTIVDPNFYLSANTLQLDVGGSNTLTVGTSNAAVLPYLENVQWYNYNPSVVSVYGTNTTLGTTAVTGSAISLYGLTAGTAQIDAYLTINNQAYYYATCMVTVGATGADVYYTTTVGQSFALDAKDFQDFWTESVTGYGGALQYVVFGSPSGSVGSLVYNRYSGLSYQNSISASGATFYVSPGYNQYSISDVTFKPAGTTTSTYNRTGTLTVPFTAYGTTSYSTTATTTISGTLYIVVTNGEVDAITYQPSGNLVNLNSTDFINVYKKTFSSTATSNPTVYIQFLDVPQFGELYTNYTTAGYLNSGNKLTTSNIGAMRFASRAGLGYTIDNLTYVASAASRIGDTVRYAAYSAATGGTMLYVGEIVFGAGTTPVIKYYTTNGVPVSFDSDDFQIQALGSMEYITFGKPLSGKLYTNYANGTGTAVTPSTTFKIYGGASYSVASVDSVTFVPSVTGVVNISFTASNILTSQLKGDVKVYVGKTFSDVASTHWAKDFILQLTAEGIVNGKTATTFAPDDDLKYGEALKLIMEAAGYASQAKTGEHWASGYLTRAYRDGLVTSNNIDLESKIDRTTVATIAAKALKISPAASVNAGIAKPADTTNGYVLALYNAGILNGTNANGKNYYYGTKTISRAEISKIICLVSDYNA